MVCRLLKQTKPATRGTGIPYDNNPSQSSANTTLPTVKTFPYQNHENRNILLLDPLAVPRLDNRLYMSRIPKWKLVKAQICSSLGSSHIFNLNLLKFTKNNFPTFDFLMWSPAKY